MAARDSVDLNGAENSAPEGFYSGILPQTQPAAPGAAVRVAQVTASAPPAIIVVELEDGNIARLPAGADISNARANGTDLEFLQPDGTVIVITGGAIANLVLFIGDIQIPAEAVAQIFATNDIQTAAGSEGGNTTPDGTGSYEDLGEQNVGEGETAIDLLLNTELPADTASIDEQVSTNFAAQVLGGTDALIADDGLSEGNRPDGESDSKFAEGTIVINETGATFAFDLPTTKFTSGGNDIEWTLDDTNRVIGTIPGQEGPFIAVEATIDPASGAWRVEIFAPLDHFGIGQGELLTLLFPVRITDAGGIPTLTALSVAVEDDTPIARNDPGKGDSEASEGDSAALNLILTFDVSGSMGEHEGSPNFDDRLDLSIQAAVALINASNPQSVLVVTFSNNAHASMWMTKEEALEYLADSIPSANGGTDYEDALEAIQAAYAADPPSGETKSYFFTDGDPSDGGISNDDQDDWDDFLSQNKIESFAVGAGDGISQNDNDLKDIASSPDSSHVIILDGDDLEPFEDLVETAPPQQASVSGNVLANDSFGADGGEGVFSITVNGITYLRSVYEMDVVEVKETSTGGTLIFNFSNGNWEYFAPDEMGQSGVATFSYTIMDNDGDPSTASVSITVTAVNDAPDLILGLASGSYRDAFENTHYNNSDGSTDWSGNAWSENSDGGSGANGGTIRISGDELRFGADDDSASITRTLDLSGATSATLTFNFKDVNTEANNNERLTVEFSANGTNWVILDVLDANDPDGLKTFNLTGPFDSDAKIRFSVTDMSQDSEYLAIDNVNVAYTGVASPIYVENGPAVQILAGASVIDPDGPANFNGGSLQVLLSNSSSGDQLLFTGANVSVSGTDVVTTPYGIVGTVTGLGTTSLLITFNANATPAAISVLLDAIAFSSTSENPSNGIRTAHVTFNDGGNTGTGGPLSDTETVQFGVTPVNDAPVATVPAGPFPATEQQNFNLHGKGLSVSDVDAGNDRISVTLSVTHGVITVVRGNSGIDNGDVSGSGTSSVTIQGSTSEINNLLGGLGTGTVVFNANSDNPPPGATLTLLVNDTGDNGSGGPQTDSKTVAINITPVNDAPSSTNDSVTTNEDTSKLLTLADFGTYGDPEGTAVASVKITTLESNGSLEYDTTGSGSWTSVMTNQVIVASEISAGRLRFVPDGNENGTPYTTVGFQVGDGVAFSAANILTINVTPVNDAPVLNSSASPSAASVDEDSGPPSGSVGTLISALVNLNPPGGGLDNVTDPDNNPVTGVAITGLETTNGKWWFSLNGSSGWTQVGVAVSDASALLLGPAARIYFQPNANYDGDADITFRAWDQTGGTAGNRGNTTTNGASTAFSSSTDTVTVDVIGMPENAVPVGGTDRIFTNASARGDGTSISVQKSWLMVNDADADGDALSITDADDGTNIDNTGTTSQAVSFRVDINAPGTGNFTYDLSDGTESVVVGVNVTRGSNDASIIGGSLDDILVEARGESTTLDGGSGKDYIIGGAADDIIRGETNDYLLDGGFGTDTLQVSGDFTSSGNAQLVNVENVEITGSTGRTLNLSNQTETLKIDGSSGGDTIHGGSGADKLNGQAGNDTVTGNGGTDQFRLATNTGADTITDYMDGTDKIAFLDTGSNGGGSVNFSNTSGSPAGTTLSASDLTQRTDIIDISGNDDDNQVIVITTELTTAQIQAGDSGSNASSNLYVFAFNSTTGRGEIWFDTDWSNASGRVQIATLNNITTLAGITAITNTDIVAYSNAIDPLILDLDGNGFNLAAAAHFDLDHDGTPDHLGWPGAGDGMLVADLDHSGAIENGNEVFSPEFGEGGHKDSLAALTTYDSNGDGKITADDTGFGDLQVWQDLNGDGVTDAGELSGLADLGIVEIDLGADEVDWSEDGQHVFAAGSFSTADGATHDYIGVDLGAPFAATQTGTAAVDTFVVDGSALEYIADYDFDGGDKVDLSELLGNLGADDAANYVKLEGDTLKVDVDGDGTGHDFHDVATFSSTQDHVTVTIDTGFDIIIDKA